MGKPREQLQTLLMDILGTNQVYYQPPESIKMSYPAIIYDLNNIGTIHANNHAYTFTKSYDITFVTYDPNPDSDVNKRILELPLCKFNRHYTADNLHHFVYVLYF